MSQPNAVTLHPKVIIQWLRNEADSSGEDGDIDSFNKFHAFADDLEKIYEAAIYGDCEVGDAIEHVNAADGVRAEQKVEIFWINRRANGGSE